MALMFHSDWEEQIDSLFLIFLWVHNKFAKNVRQGLYSDNRENMALA